MSPAPSALQRRDAGALAVLALVGWVIRAWPLVVSPGALAVPIDYDEGVYFSASALLFDGVWPYRDFVFVHPPGVLYLLGVVTAWVGTVDAASAFVAVRVLASLVGAINIALVGRLASRWAGPAAGLVAAALYAVAPEVVRVERGPFLEPLLNLACLALATAWLRGDEAPPTTRAAWAAGALAGLAFSIKVWAALWVVAAVVTAVRASRAVHFLAAAGATVAVLIGPLALAGPEAFLRDVVLFHTWRPPDGQVERLGRLVSMFGSAHAAAAFLALGGLGCGTWTGAWRTSRAFRLTATVYVLTVAAFLASASYWRQYTAQLAVSEALLAGFAASKVWGWATKRFPHVFFSRLAPVLLAAVCVPSALRTARGSEATAPYQLELGDTLRPLVAAKTCVWGFEPAWSLVGGALPPALGTTRIVDSYAVGLLDAVEGGQRRFSSAAEAFASPRAQQTLRAALETCDAVVVGDRGRRQLGPDAEAWLTSHFQQHAAPTGGPDLWKRTAP